jgi:hypothetical protein
MLSIALVAALLQVAPETAQPTEDVGIIEFSRDPSLGRSHSIKIFALEGENQRLRYLDDIGHQRGRTLTLEARPGTHEFVVIVQPTGSGVDPAAPTNPERRREPNAVVEVEAGRLTQVTIGGFTDFERTPRSVDDRSV